MVNVRLGLDLRELTRALHRYLVGHVLYLRVWHGGDHLRAHHRRCESVAGDAALGILLADDLGQPDHSGFRRAVRQHACVS